MTNRNCSKQGCNQAAIATLTFDYGTSVAVLGPLSGQPEPHAHDLCASHVRNFTPPNGWQLVKHRSVA